MSKSPSNKRRGGNASSRPGNMKLGRGLSALMSDISVPSTRQRKRQRKSLSAKKTKTKTAKPKTAAAKAPTSTRGIQETPIDRIERNPDQPRRHFDKALMFQLTNSIRDKGVLQPILVRPLPRSYEAKGTKNKRPLPNRSGRAALAGRVASGARQYSRLSAHACLTAKFWRWALSKTCSALTLTP